MAGRGSIGGRFGSAAPGCVHKVFGERNWECRMKNSECRTRMLKMQEIGTKLQNCEHRQGVRRKNKNEEIERRVNPGCKFPNKEYQTVRRDIEDAVPYGAKRTFS